MEKREKLEKQKNYSSRLISKKCENIEADEYENIKINFPPGNHQSEFTYEDDQYLIYITNKYGYGNWDDIMRDIKTSEDLLFNYYLKSRNKAEIQKRIDYLVKLIEKELGNIIKGNNNGEENSMSLILKNNNKKKKNGKKEIGIVIDEDYEEEKNNNEDNIDMYTDDEEIYRDNNSNSNSNSNVNNNKEVKKINNNGNVKNVAKNKNKVGIVTGNGNDIIVKGIKKRNINRNINMLGKKRKIIKKKK